MIPLRRRLGRGIALLVAAVLPTACAAPVGVDRPGIDRVYSDLRANALNRGVPSGTSRVVLDRYDLWSEWHSTPDRALDRLLDAAAKDDRRDGLFALAELHLLAALDGWGRDHALVAAAFAEEYLFAAAPGRPPDPWDSAFEEARDLEARALLEAFRVAPGEPEVRFEAGPRKLPRGTMDLSVEAATLPLEPGPLPPFFPAEEYAIRGLRVRHRRGGIGLALVARPPPLTESQVKGLLYKGRPAFAATAVLRAEGGVAALAAGRVRATLSILPSAGEETVEMGGRRVPLAADFTAPFALALEGARVWSFELGGLFSREPEFRPGLILTAPHKAGRIPVVLVHGTASSPARWAELVNTLYGEKRIRDRYELWLFIYATGNPIAYSARLLRESLAEAASYLDPEGNDPAIRRMILVGHSQGGLLCRMTASASGDFLANAKPGLRLEDVEMSDETRTLVRECMEFAPSPTVARCIYLCTPHAGSFLAAGLVGSVTNAFANIGRSVKEMTTRPFRTKTGEVKFPSDLEISTSVENMRPGSPFLAAIAGMTLGPGVRFHTIAAVTEEGDPAGLDDGVVAYASAHLDGADSEFVVHDSHSCQANALVIEEVRRILLLEGGDPPAVKDATGKDSTGKDAAAPPAGK